MAQADVARVEGKVMSVRSEGEMEAVKFELEQDDFAVRRRTGDVRGVEGTM